MMDSQNQFREAMQAEGLHPPEVIQPGWMHRFPGVSKRKGNTAAWCTLFLDGRGGCFGDWSTGLKKVWHTNQETWSSSGERETFYQQVAETQKQAAAERKKAQDEAAVRAKQILDRAPLAAASAPYLRKKDIQSHGVRTLRNGTLVIPLSDGRNIRSIQFIRPDGLKRFLSGGQVLGCYYVIGELHSASTLCIAEGFATGATIHEATGYPVVVAFTADNMPVITQLMRNTYPNLDLIVCADDDAWTDGNPGLTKATEAARSVGARLAVPEFGPDRPRAATDFNDMAASRGKAAVREAIERTAFLSDEGGAGVWKPPQPICAELKPVPNFDADTLLPDALRAFVMNEAERMPCPPDFIAAALIVMLGSVIGTCCAIKPKSFDSWLIVANVWGAIVGDPSAKKSPAVTAALKALDRLISIAKKAHSEADAEYQSLKFVFEAVQDAIQKRIKDAAKDSNKLKKGEPEAIAKELRAHNDKPPAEPKLRRYKTNDTTVEKLGELLRDNLRGLLVLRDELVGLIASWEREGREGDRAFFLESWNGNQGFDTDRIGRGHISIPNLCISIFGGIQPDKLTVYLEQAANALANDGMLQRFQILVYPDPCPWEWRDIAPDKDARDTVFAVFETLANFEPTEWGAAPADESAKFPSFSFNDEAQKIFIEWSEDLHCHRLPAEDEPIMRQDLAKYDKLFPALALIFHLVECASKGVRGPVTKESALRAAAWCEFLEAHARRCYGLLKDDGLRAAQALAAKLRKGALADGFTARDVRRNQWRNLTKDEAIQAALDWLEDEDWLRSVETGGTGPGTGRRTVRYFINPAILAKCKTGKA